MATSVVAATEAAAKRLPHRFGNKQIFLPNHIVTFIRPKPRQPPNLATFVVPLQFNKLDLRDYLYHAYDVEVTSVRSFINQAAPAQKHRHFGKSYRPRSQKMMIAELVKPFVWPTVPDEKDREAFDHEMFARLTAEREDQMDKQVDPSVIPLRTQTPVTTARKDLKAQAAEFLKRGEWTNGKAEDGKWTEVDKDFDV
ncbi:hypothetical protein C8A00DRAFT_36458 [Chaetomidium leptoderma]|uniref:Large ribosomal subunit protein uL23m n=1 Tax=Chaetomidium leptoderma TaxID=669021 RepID=A0AAN6ZUU4_9PEZI|nr:hypothetical protein C8A00DRAFT_36458 [Chaetomidium leptoderma]